jgi:hypothetical protein
MPFEFAVVVKVDGSVWMILRVVAVVTVKDETSEDRVVNNNNRKNRIMLLHLLFKSIEVEVEVKVKVEVMIATQRRI